MSCREQSAGERVARMAWPVLVAFACVLDLVWSCGTAGEVTQDEDDAQTLVDPQGAEPEPIITSATTHLVLDRVQTLSGPILGGAEAGVRAFKGIPYAAPPVGALRWRPPQGPTRWTAVRQALAYGPACPQHEDDVLGSVVSAMDEDCLYLNVWTPARYEEDKLPVMFWIHGGGFILGSGTHPNSAGANLAGNSKVVVVSINYRLGKLGFLAHPELAAEDVRQVSGNYGLKDQIFALQWVRDNIRKFGGNPGNVTIFGESAGGVSVGMLMASPLARGLFHRAIIQSAAASEHLPPLRGDSEGQKSVETLGVEFVQGLGIMSTANAGAIQQLRAWSWQDILAADDMEIVLPGRTVQDLIAMDGYVLPDAPYEIFKAGAQAPVPLMIGTTQEEGSIFVGRVPVGTVAALRLLLIMAFGLDTADQLLDLYDVEQASDARPAYSQMLTDIFISSARRTIRAHVAAGHTAYLYHFTRSLPWMDILGLGAFHSCEIGYVFGNLAADLGYTSDDDQLAKTMMGYWSRFARQGNPNALLVTKWPPYDRYFDRHLVLDVSLSVDRNLRKPYCDFLDSVM